MSKRLLVVILLIYAVLLTILLVSMYLMQAVGSETRPSGGREIPVIEPLTVDESSLRVVKQHMERKQDQMLFPINKSDFLMYTSPYGHRISPLLNIEMVHQGVDIAGVWKAEVVAVADGTVVEHWPVPGTPYPGGGFYRGHEVYGGLIVIDHGDFESRYAHLSYSRVFQGQRIRAGEVIGRIGDTGKADGYHLHFELLKDSRTVNPLLYVEDPREE